MTEEGSVVKERKEREGEREINDSLQRCILGEHEESGVCRRLIDLSTLGLVTSLGILQPPVCPIHVFLCSKNLSMC